jgi:hypothetical protein
LEPTGTITVFFTICALTRPEHLRAEVLRPIGPAQPAARNLPPRKMHAFEARRVDEDLEHRLRLGQAGTLAGSNLNDRKSALAAASRRQKFVRDVALHERRYWRSTRSSDRFSTSRAPLDRALMLGGARAGTGSRRPDRSAP